MKFSAQSCIYRGGGCETMQECWKLFDELDFCNEVNNTWLHSFAHQLILLGLIQFSWQQWQFDQTLKREAVLILFLSIKNNKKIHPNGIRPEKQQWKTNLWLQPIVLHLIIKISFYVMIAINLQNSVYLFLAVLFFSVTHPSHTRVFSCRLTRHFSNAGGVAFSLVLVLWSQSKPLVLPESQPFLMPHPEHDRKNESSVCWERTVP